MGNGCCHPEPIPDRKMGHSQQTSIETTQLGSLSLSFPQKRESTCVPMDSCFRRNDMTGEGSVVVTRIWKDTVYNCARHVRTLRVEVSDGVRRWRCRSPMMAAGFTDHIWLT